MRRKRALRRENTTQTEQFDAKYDLEARVRRLEESVFKNKAEVSSHPKKRIKMKSGPKPKRPPTIYDDRDDFVYLFESYWPEIEPKCVPPIDIEGLKRIFTALTAMEIGKIAEAAKKLLDRLPFIEEFFANPKLRDRFRGDPRVLAGALAGVPEVGQWRSLKLCPPITCKLPMGDRAVCSYIRRKHPALHNALTVGIDTLGLGPWLKEYRTRDKTLKKYSAQELIDAWKASVPNLDQLFEIEKSMKSRWGPLPEQNATLYIQSKTGRLIKAPERVSNFGRRKKP
jgi:hypothetical protein